MTEKFLVIGTTSKHKKDFLKLPDKEILGGKSENYLIHKFSYIDRILQNPKYKDYILIADVEEKQFGNPYTYLYRKKVNQLLLDYKPNDLTMEAADLSILNYFNGDLAGKTVAVYGTGNIAFKLALRLTERNAKVYLFGRSKEKIEISVKAIEQITFNPDLIKAGNINVKVDCLISFVSAEGVIESEFINILNNESLCLDGGIGNFTSSFIKQALDKNHEVRRIDVRQSQEIMDGYINSRINSKFHEIIGKREINGISLVSGGILGKDGAVIVNKISKPSTVIGIADGMGGVKDTAILNREENEKIKLVQKYIEECI